nr:hypothetical protein B0A51_11999 [Rachicladosporium sp. CCFEE 5018]
MSCSHDHEHILASFYRRASDYAPFEVHAEVVSWAVAHIELADLGGNTGTVIALVSVDINDHSKGVVKAATLLEGYSMVCFGFNVFKLAAPSYTNKLFKTLSRPLYLVLEALNVPLMSLSCRS